jgi:hypothetical protein
MLISYTETEYFFVAISCRIGTTTTFPFVLQHGLINYIDTKHNRHLKKLTCNGWDSCPDFTNHRLAVSLG